MTQHFPFTKNGGIYMIERIVIYLQEKLICSKNTIFPYVDLHMKNGDEITIYAPSPWIYGDKDFSILTNDNDIIHFIDLQSVGKWIEEKYC